MPRKTKTKGEPEKEVLTRHTRKIAAEIVEEPIASPVDEDEYFHEGAELTPKVRKPRKTGKKKRKVANKETLEELGVRYLKIMREYFSTLNHDKRFDNYRISCTLAAGDSPGEVWAFASLCNSGTKIFSLATPIVRYPDDLHHITGFLWCEMVQRGMEISDYKGLP